MRLKKRLYKRSGKKVRVGGEEKRRDNLDEEKELAEAGQQGQKASEDTVIHFPKLFKKYISHCNKEMRENGETKDVDGGRMG